MMRKRGRPKGTIAGKRLTEAWNPKKWKPLYDSILALAVVGLKNTDIAIQLNINKVTVGLILNSPAGKSRLLELQKKKQAVIAKTLAERIENLQDKALRRVEDVISNDSFAELAPFKVFDRSMSVLRATGLAKSDNPNSETPVVNNNTINLINDRAMIAQMSMGIDKALEASKLNAAAFAELGAGRSVKVIDRQRLP